MLLDADAARGPTPARLRLIHIAAVAAGNGLEFFDFLIYATFAIYIGKAFFPTHDPTVSLLLSLATFGIGFVTRPIGASFADWLSKPPSISGLGLGDGTVSALALVVFIALVSYVTITRCDVQGERAPAQHPDPRLLLDAELE